MLNIAKFLNTISMVCDYCGEKAPVPRTLAPPSANNSSMSAEPAPIYN